MQTIEITMADADDDNDEQSQPPPLKSKLLNRMILCLFALCLLWLTTLQLSVAIVNEYITIPMISNVAESCQTTFAKVNEQRNQYTACADRQVVTCQEQLDAANRRESMRVHDATVRNRALFSQYSSVVTNCSEAQTTAQSAMKDWMDAAESDYDLPFQSTCTMKNRDSVNAWIGADTTKESKQSLYSSAVQYVTSTEGTVSRLAEYSNTLSQYNEEYLNNKTKKLQMLSVEVVNEVSAPRLAEMGHSFDSTYDVLDMVSACIGLAKEGTVDDGISSEPLPHCAYSDGARVLYDQAMVVSNSRMRAMQNAVTAAQDYMDNYGLQVATAVEQADRFYDSVSGAQGIIRWVVQNTGGLFGSSSVLCGQSTPNWCSFSPADWYLPPPMLPDFPNLQFMVDADSIWEQVCGRCRKPAIHPSYTPLY